MKAKPREMRASINMLRANGIICISPYLLELNPNEFTLTNTVVHATRSTSTADLLVMMDAVE
jgi:hypothetical protein